MVLRNHCTNIQEILTLLGWDHVWSYVWFQRTIYGLFYGFKDWSTRVINDLSNARQGLFYACIP